MPYRYETHLHTSQASACGSSKGSEHARFYKEMGYHGIIVTDHFFGGNTCIPERLPWKKRVERFCSGYEDALIMGQKIGLDVFFAWEQRFAVDEYLVYGLSPEWLLQHPEVERWNRREQLEGVHRYGGCVIQAHPFRDRDYIDKICLAPQFSDGIEVANAGNFDYNDAYALRYAQEYNLLTIAGSDNHNSAYWKRYPKGLMGIETEEPIRDMQQFAQMLLSRKGFTPIIPEGRFDVQPKDIPELFTYWYNDKERAVPTNRKWFE